MEILNGSRLIDTYSKRSATIIDKVVSFSFSSFYVPSCTAFYVFLTLFLQCKELEKLTGAFVVIYTARLTSFLSVKCRSFNIGPHNFFQAREH